MLHNKPARLTQCYWIHLPIYMPCENRIAVSNHVYHICNEELSLKGVWKIRPWLESGSWKNPRQLCKLSTVSGFAGLSRILPTPFVFRWGYESTEKIFHCLISKYPKLKAREKSRVQCKVRLVLVSLLIGYNTGVRSFGQSLSVAITIAQLKFDNHLKAALAHCSSLLFLEQNPSEQELKEFKQFILEKCDDNFDGKISMPEVMQEVNQTEQLFNQTTWESVI